MNECCTELNGIAVYAEDTRFIVSSYVAAFLTWSILFKFDFISEKWRTISSVEKSASLHLIITIPPMSMVLFYTYVQGKAGDIKEMMTAIVSICLALFHIGRTFWGILQLGAFKDWCNDALHRMRLIGIKLTDQEIDFKRRILVNNSVVDNEIGGDELKVTLFPWKNYTSKQGRIRVSKILKTSEPYLCTLRWTATFLCAYGNRFRGFSDKFTIKNIFRMCPCSLESLFNVIIEKRNAEFKKSMVSAQEVILKGQSKAGAYESVIPNYKFVSSEEQYELEFNSQLGNYPRTSSKGRHGDPENASIQLSDSLILSKIFDIDMLKSLRNLDEKQTNNPVYVENGWRILLDQHFELKKDEELNWHHMKIPPFPWRTLMLPLWEVDSNCRVLQASLHRDNFTALDNGIVFKNEKILEESVFESFRKAQKYNSNSSRVLYRFVGCVLETIRSFIAKWLQINSARSKVEDWFPSFVTNTVFVCNVPLSEFCFSIGEKDECKFRRDERIIYEVQNFLNKIINENLKQNKHLLECPCVVCLFILGYPCLKKELHTDEEDKMKVLLIKPGLLVQNIYVQIKMNPVDKIGYLEIKFNENENVFKWQSWINSALGIMKGWDDLQKASRSETVRERTIQEIDLTKPLRNIQANNQNLPYLSEGIINIWLGWPYFDIKICSYEMNSWLNAKGLNLEKDIDKEIMCNAEESLEILKNTFIT